MQDGEIRPAFLCAGFSRTRRITFLSICFFSRSMCPLGHPGTFIIVLFYIRRKPGSPFLPVSLSFGSFRLLKHYAPGFWLIPTDRTGGHTSSAVPEDFFIHPCFIRCFPPLLSTCLSSGSPGLLEAFRSGSVADDGIRHEQSSVIGRSGNFYSFSSYIPSVTYPATTLVPLYFSLLYQSCRLSCFSFRRSFDHRIGFIGCECRLSRLILPF